MSLAKSVALVVVLAYSVTIASAKEDSRTSRPPNIVVVLIDDLRWDDLGCMGHPFVKTPHIDRIASEGARFVNAFATTPLCSPSRASILTGTYPHRHGIVDNTERGPQSHKLATFPRALQRAGYETAFVGKWHMGNDASPRPGFDYWVCLEGQGSSNDPTLNIDGRARPATGYVTDLLHERAAEFLSRQREKPFLLYFAHKALHPETVQRADGSISDPTASNFIPAERHRALYEGATIQRRPNALEPPRGKPALERQISGLPPLGPATGGGDAAILGRLRMLAAVDESLGKLLQLLTKTNQLDRTLVVVMSDHGYFYGEHGLSVERRLAYEEAIRIPLLMRLPELIRAGSTPEQMVLTIDLAPTCLELAGLEATAGLQGRSMLPIFKDEADDWRNQFLIEHSSDIVFPRTKQMGYAALRTKRWKLIRYTDLVGMDELYDLESDPYELKNRIADPTTRETLGQLRRDLERLRPAR